MKLLSRRTALIGGGGLLGLGALTVGGSLAVCASGSAPQNLFMIRPLFVGLRDMHDPDRIGWGLLDQIPSHQVLEELSSRSDLASIALLADPDLRHAALDQIFRQDFGQHDTVLVENWLMSQTEARIAAAWTLWGPGRS